MHPHLQHRRTVCFLQQVKDAQFTNPRPVKKSEFKLPRSLHSDMQSATVNLGLPTSRLCSSRRYLANHFACPRLANPLRLSVSSPNHARWIAVLGRRLFWARDSLGAADKHGLTISTAIESVASSSSLRKTQVDREVPGPIDLTSRSAPVDGLRCPRPSLLQHRPFAHALSHTSP
jgi:hypothetical protein